MAENKNEREELEVIATLGIPASGKSTWALNKVKYDPNWVRVNRDDFRFMMKNAPVCDPKVENLITSLSFHAIDAALAKKFNVIVDNTHLRVEYIEALADHVKYKAKFSIKPFDISLEKALEYDKNREKSVGEEVLKKMWKQYRNITVGGNGRIFETRSIQKQIYTPQVYDPNLPEAILCDLDGTLAHMNGKRGPFEWLKTDVDDLDEAVAKTIKDHMALGHTIIFMSGRSEEGRKPTEQWLEFYGFKYHALYMRSAGDNRKDNLVKAELYEKYIKGKYNVRHIYDDRQQVVDMWRALGLKVYQVERGDF